MSRDGYDRWDEQPSDPDAHDPRDGRRPRRAGRADEQWLPDSQAQDQSRRQGSHRRSGQHPGAGTPESGYTDPGYEDAGYSDGGYGRPGYAGPGYPDSGYAGSGYAEPGYPDAGPGDPGYRGSGQAGAGQADGYGRTGGYGRSAGYPDSGQSGSGYFDPESSGAGESGLDYPDPGAAGSRGHRNSGEHDATGYEAGYRGADYPNGYREAAYPPNGYPPNGHRDSRYGPTGTARPAPEDPFAPRAPFPSQDDPYAAPEPYGRGSGGHTDPRGGRGSYEDDTLGSSRPGGAYGRADGYGGAASYGGPDSYREPAGYDTGDPYLGQDARGQRGASQAGYQGPARPEYGGGFDDRDYGAAAGPDPHEYLAHDADYVRGADRDERYGWRGSPDDSGVTRRREREPEDELDADSARHNGFFRGFGAPDDEVGHRPPRRRRSRAGMVALVVVITFIGGLVGAGAYGYSWYSHRHADWTNSAGYGSVMVQVMAGDVACGQTLESTLVSKGVVASASAFCTAAKASGQSNLLQPGYFRLRLHMGAALAWKLIISPKARVQTKVAVPDGMRASKVIALLAAKTGIPLSQFQSALKDTAALGLPSWAKGNPEGFLWPATYNLQPGTSALAILQMMVKQFNTEIASLNLAAKAKAAQFTEYQVIIQASLLEGEVPPQYYGQVARVIDNRLNQSPPWNLGLDSTVAYAVNKYIYNLSQSDLNVHSPYNTTKYPGLPPGPIDSPDAAAIQAVLHPAHGVWLYFVTVNKKGTTLFTSSSSTFNTWAQEAKRNGI